ncbi:MAG: phage tail protein [Flavobacteriaceae bacterium]
MANQKIPPVGFYFTLSFNGEEYGFQEVSGISSQMETNEIAQGGENRFVHQLPTIQNLVLKRGMASQNSALHRWCQETLEGNMSNPIKTHTILVQLLDTGSGVIFKSWQFYNAYPVKWSVSPLLSNTNEVVIETLEMVYSYFQVKHI